MTAVTDMHTIALKFIQTQTILNDNKNTTLMNQATEIIIFGYNFNNFFFFFFSFLFSFFFFLSLIHDTTQSFGD